MSNVPWKLLGFSICGSLPMFLERSVRFCTCTKLWTGSNYSDLELEMDAEEFSNNSLGLLWECLQFTTRRYLLETRGCLSSQVEEMRDPLLRVSACDMDLRSLHEDRSTGVWKHVEFKYHVGFPLSRFPIHLGLCASSKLR